MLGTESFARFSLSLRERVGGEGDVLGDIRMRELPFDARDHVIKVA